MTRRAYLLLPVALLALVAACEPAPAPTPMPPLPALERPVLRLNEDSKRANVLIPEGALVMRGGAPGVFVLSDAGRARFRLVRPGARNAGRVAILSGLDGNETLVLGDLGHVHDGTPIHVK